MRLQFVISASAFLNLCIIANSLTDTDYHPGSRHSDWKKPAVAPFHARMVPWRQLAARNGSATITVHSHLIDDGFSQRCPQRSAAQDFQPFEDLLAVISRPYDELEKYSAPARPEECVVQTFCGT